MKTFLKVSATLLVLGFTAITGYFLGNYDAYWKSHDEFLGRCLEYARGYPDTGWCKYFVGDLKGRQ